MKCKSCEAEMTAQEIEQYFDLCEICDADERRITEIEEDIFAPYEQVD